MQQEECSLTRIANQHKTDKGTISGNRHAYTCVYDMFFSPMRDKTIDLMEIGLNVGGPELGFSADREVADIPSAKMWHEYFPSAHIHGVDISDFSKYTNEYFTFYRADCGDAAALDAVASTAPQCDIIIDDGSHASYHQQLTLLKLFPRLKSRGLYVIEDLHWQPRQYESELPKVQKTRDLLLGYFQSAEFKDTGAIPFADWQPLQSGIENVMFFDQKTLDQMGKFFNAVEGNESKYPVSKLLTRSHLKNVIVKGAEFANAVIGNTNPVRPATKLVIIQKK